MWPPLLLRVHRKRLGRKRDLIPLYDVSVVVATDTSALEETRRIGEDERNKRVKVPIQIKRQRIIELLYCIE